MTGKVVGLASNERGSGRSYDGGFNSNCGYYIDKRWQGNKQSINKWCTCGLGYIQEVARVQAKYK